ncbi:MAG: phosphopantothenoylcysteine decarboxylase [Planctomycetota bacterium]
MASHDQPDAEASRTPRVLVAAGPTHEPIDDVRYLANRSSGRLGAALAETSSKRGWPTTLLMGPCTARDRLEERIAGRRSAPGRPLADAASHNNEPPSGQNGPAEQRVASHLDLVRFRTAADLQALLLERVPAIDVLVMAAAVADFRPAGHVHGKLERGETITLALEPVPDLLAEARRGMTGGAIAIGFALEADAASDERGRRKLERKGCDAIVVNPLDTMDSADIDARILFADADRPPRRVGPMGKAAFASVLLDVAAELWRAAGRPSPR